MRWTPFFFFLGTLAGCGRNHEFAEVNGTVTLNDQPLAGVFVRFYPVTDDFQQRPVSAGTTDEAGRYTLTHDGKKLGALVGRHRVAVAWPPRDVREFGKDGVPMPKPSAVIPRKYSAVMDSPLDVEVKPGGPQTLDLKLVDNGE